LGAVLRRGNGSDASGRTIVLDIKFKRAGEQTGVFGQEYVPEIGTGAEGFRTTADKRYKRHIFTAPAAMVDDIQAEWRTGF